MTRYRAVDAARGIALVLMIFIHGMRLSSTLSRTNVKDWSLDWDLWVLSKAATPLFFLCFGMALTFQPPARKHLWIRALQVFLSAQALLALELAFAPPAPDPMGQWSTILQFYWIALLLAPFWLRLWTGCSYPFRAALVLALLLLTAWPPTGLPLMPQLLLFGQPERVSFPFIPWMPVVLLGVTLGERLPHLQAKEVVAAAVLCVVAFLFTLHEEPRTFFFEDKYPPRLTYILWTTAYALALLAAALALYGSERQAPSRTNPLEVLGRHSLLAFNLHLGLMFLVAGAGLHILRTMPTDYGRWVGLLLVLVVMLLVYGYSRLKPTGVSRSEGS